MQDFVPAFAQPFFRLTQANMELFAKYGMPQAGGAPALPPLDSIAKLNSGLIENYVKFVMELMQGGVAAIAQAPTAFSPAAFWQPAQQAEETVEDNVVDAAEVRTAKPRKVA
jgi:hypothetical protein